MGRHEPNGYWDTLRRSEDYTALGVVRSAVRHDLMDKAAMTADMQMWRDIGETLVRACDRDDLTPQVSDHFVRDCPTEVFKDFATTSPCDRFVKWQKRAKRLSRLL